MSLHRLHLEGQPPACPHTTANVSFLPATQP